MGHDAAVVRLGDRSDLATSRQTAREADVGPDEDRHVAREQLLNSQIELRRSPMAIGESMRLQISAWRPDRVDLDGVLDEQGAELRQGVAHHDRLGRVELAVQLEDQVDLVAAGLARRGSHRAGRADELADRQVLVAVYQRVELDGREPFLDGPVDRRADLVRSPAANKHVQADPVARAAAEQLPDRQLERLALDVPEREIDRRDRRREQVAAERSRAVDEVPEVLDPERVRADEQRVSSPSTPATPCG